MLTDTSCGSGGYYVVVGSTLLYTGNSSVVTFTNNILESVADPRQRGDQPVTRYLGVGGPYGKLFCHNHVRSEYMTAL